MLSLYLVSGVAGVVGAHTLSGEEDSLSQLGHQLLGLHHLPVAVVLVFCGIVLYRSMYRSAPRSNMRRR